MVSVSPAPGARRTLKYGAFTAKDCPPTPNLTIYQFASSRLPWEPERRIVHQPSDPDDERVAGAWSELNFEARGHERNGPIAHAYRRGLVLAVRPHLHDHA